MSKLTKKDQTHCIRGHELSGENVWNRIDKQGRPHRVCKKCKADKKKENDAQSAAQTKRWILQKQEKLK